MTDYGEPLELTFLGKDRDSVGGNSPTAWATNRGTFVVQGYRITDERALAQLRESGLPDYETAVEVPAHLMQYFNREA